MGAKVYEHNCSSCHGRDAGGDDRQVYPRLAAQHYEYLSHRVREALDGQQSNFSGTHLQLLQRLEGPDLAAVCDYLSRLEPR